VPHFVFGEEIAAQRRGQHHERRADDRTGHGDEQGVAQIVQLEDRDVVAQVDAPREEIDLAGGNKGVVADRVDEQIIERKDAQQRKDAEQRIVDDAEHDIARRIDMPHFCGAQHRSIGFHCVILLLVR
jgi:hypothetical protein